MGSTSRSKTTTDNASYDRLFESFGALDPKSSGYRSARMFERHRAMILAAVGEAPGRVLDLACGGGLMTRPLVARGIAVVGLDYNEPACRTAVQGGLTMCRGDAFALPFADGSFDTVLSAEFLQQYPLADMRRLVAETCRVTAPGGRVVLVWRNGNALIHRLAYSAFAVLDRLRGTAPLRLYSAAPDLLAATAAEAGFAVESCRAVFSPLRLSMAPDGAGAAVLGASHILVLRRPKDGEGDAP